jgi:hypothetical protein
MVEREHAGCYVEGVDHVSRVFVVHQPTGRDRSTGAIKPTMDLSPAREWGELRFILREWENPFADFDATVAEVRRVLLGEGLSDEDWLLLVGNPCLIGLVAAEAARITGGLRMLQWDRSQHRYLAVSAQLPVEDGPPHEG